MIGIQLRPNSPDGRPRVLAVTSELPWPLDSGGHLRTYHMVRGLARDFEVTLVAGVLRGESPGVSRLADDGIRVRPVPLPARKSVNEALRMAGAALGHRPYVLYTRHDRRAMWSALRAQLADAPPDVVYLDHLDSFQFSPLVGHTPFVIDCHNVCSVLVRRQAVEGHNGVSRLYLLREARLLEVVERRAAQTAAALFAVSAEDLRIFSSYGAKRAELVPNGVDCAHYAGIPLGQRSGDPLILYVGAMSWAPNASAAVFLAREALPRIQSTCPNVRLRIVGRQPPRAVAELARLPAVEVTGAVPDVRPHLRAAHVLAVPLETGGGSRLKILEAFAAGLPVISTAVGCEGLEVLDARHLVIAERGNFAEAISWLLQNPAAMESLAREARNLAAARYDWQAIGTAASAVLKSVMKARG